MVLEPLYTPENVHFAFQLNWSLSLFWKVIPPAVESWLASLRVATEQDGTRILELSWPTPQCSQFLVSTLPETLPQAIPWSVKGRLQHLIREQHPASFQRNFDLRSLGSPTREKSEAYVASQLQHHAAADSTLRAKFADL
ncbi:hypothetical protein NA78x_004895 [Anatilimnocola sp. NA78]|uniref:hypothetical protein n=1 Tax=Anatilimnocola sp. NA78 TaxID=3415683 RepID=UPI003CE4CA8A